MPIICQVHEYRPLAIYVSPSPPPNCASAMSLNLTVDDFRTQITSMTNTHTWESILTWLAERDVIISRASLGRRLKPWEVCSHTRILRGRKSMRRYMREGRNMRSQRYVFPKS